MLNLTFQEFNVVDAGFPLVLVSQSEHFIRHVETVGFTCRAYLSGRKQYVDVTAGIQYSLAWIEPRQGRGVTTTERGKKGLFRDLRCREAS